MTELNSLTGHLEGLAKGLQSRSYIASVLEYSHALMAEEVDNFVDLFAKASPLNYHHVYEWPSTYNAWHETVGVPAFRLWKHTLTGSPSNKVASYRFMASKRTVPVNPKLKAVGVMDKVHIFYLKASVMELGLPVTITPSLQKSSGTVGLSFIGTKGPTAGKPVFIAGQNAVLRPKPNLSLQGRFHDLYSTWWGAESDKYFDERIGPKLAKDLPLQRMVKKRSASAAGLKVQSQNGAVDEVIRRLKKNEKSYVAGAQARRDLILGNG